MTTWMTVWTCLLAFTAVAFCVLLVVVGVGAIAELKQSLRELKEDADAAAAHPETLDEAV